MKERTLAVKYKIMHILLCKEWEFGKNKAKLVRRKKQNKKKQWLLKVGISTKKVNR